MDTYKGKYVEDMVSVIMPAYNSEGCITAAVKSVLEQTFTNLELIICDDASKDGTLKTVKSAATGDSRVIIIENESNSGVAKTRNNAMKKASGRFIAFLDSDDLWKRDKLEKQLDFMKKSGCALCYASYGLINENGEPLKKGQAGIRETADYKSLLKNNFIGMLTVVADRSLTGDIVFSRNRHEDLILWLALAKKGLSMKGMNQSLALYRVSGNSLSGNKLKAAAWRWRVYRESEKLNFTKSIWYMLFYIVNSILKRMTA